MENLYFGRWNIGNLLLKHFQIVGYQTTNLNGDERTGISVTIDIFLNTPDIIMDIIIAGILFPATIWLRNHGFEI